MRLEGIVWISPIEGDPSVWTAEAAVKWDSFASSPFSNSATMDYKCTFGSWNVCHRYMVLEEQRRVMLMGFWSISLGSVRLG